MSTLRITLASNSISFEVDDQAAIIPVGPATLGADIRRNPPAPEELTNAIGLVMDHMEDVEREAPAVWFADTVEIAGLGVAAVAAVEVGGAPELPLPVSIEAIEDVFRTVVTESTIDRALNPGLPPEMVEPIVGVTCALVGVLRFLRPAAVSLVEA
jgi:exopolyphosphatase/guanosine-5'-triphosphate,3'-diphosphate pyrophosphatase